MLYTYLAVEATYPFEKKAQFIEIRVLKGQLSTPHHLFCNPWYVRKRCFISRRISNIPIRLGTAIRAKVMPEKFHTIVVSMSAPVEAMITKTSR